MHSNRAVGMILPDLPRRRSVQSLATGGVTIGLGLGGMPARASQARGTVFGTASVLQDAEFDLMIAGTLVNFTGKPGMATTINGVLSGPTLRWRKGGTVTTRVANRLPEPTSIHQHGTILSLQMDGAPGISFSGIAPDEIFTYRFKAQQSGSCWYYSHSGFQEMTGLYGGIVIDPAGEDRARADRDYTVLLSDWTDEDSIRVLTKLKIQDDYYSYNRPIVVDFFHDVPREGWTSAMNKRQMWNQMRMNPTDLADLSSATLTCLMDDVTPAGNWTGLFSRGQTVRLRFVNGTGNTFYDVHIPGMKMEVVQVDGQDIEPISVDEFRFGPGGTCNVVITPVDDAHMIFAQTMDRTGYTLRTLAVRQGLRATTPSVDKAGWLTMADMMDDMSGISGISRVSEMSGMSGMSGVSGMLGMDHSRHGVMHDNAASSLKVPSKKARRTRIERGPSTDMHVDVAWANLGDPGIDLRNNEQCVLILQDMHTIGGPMNSHDPQHEVKLHLTGNMERYAWSFDDVEFGKSTPVHFRYGKRLRVILRSDTMMTHPTHMHGMWSELGAPDGTFLARRHTIPVQPAQRISFLVATNALGRWAWHCHLILHMDAGIFREVIVT